MDQFEYNFHNGGVHGVVYVPLRIMEVHQEPIILCQIEQASQGTPGNNDNEEICDCYMNDLFGIVWFI